MVVLKLYLLHLKQEEQMKINKLKSQRHMAKFRVHRQASICSMTRAKILIRLAAEALLASISCPLIYV